MNDLRIVLDTNVFLVALAPHFRLHWIFQYLIQERYQLCVTTEILYEYQEIVTTKYGIDKANATLDFLMLLRNVHQINPHFKWNFLTDEDDNKYIDCVISGNADYLVSNDKGFRIMEDIDFPRIKVLTAEKFESRFKTLLGK